MSYVLYLTLTVQCSMLSTFSKPLFTLRAYQSFHYDAFIRAQVLIEANSIHSISYFSQPLITNSIFTLQLILA